jgi:hypothetical protein
MSVGWGHVCAVDVDGEAACWGDNNDGMADPEPGEFVQVAASYRETCALTAGGSVTCWGRDSLAGPPTGTWANLTRSFSGFCASTSNGYVNCWGGIDGYKGFEDFPEEQVLEMVGGDNHFCGLQVSGEAACFGDDTHRQATAPAGVFVELGAAEDLSCGLTDEGGIECWGDGAEG